MIPGASQWPACKPFVDIHSICPWANTPILVIDLKFREYYGFGLDSASAAAARQGLVSRNCDTNMMKNIVKKF